MTSNWFVHLVMVCICLNRFITVAIFLESGGGENDDVRSAHLKISTKWILCVTELGPMRAFNKIRDQCTASQNKLHVLIILE